jgi:PAS domain S-box-containing protein
LLLGVKQYAVLIVIFIAVLVSVFAYQITTKLENTRHKIELSQQQSSLNELKNAITITLDNIRQSADSLSQWQEVRQQIENPDIFAYWYNVRFKKLAFDLQKYTQDLMIYDINGRALAQLDDNTLPYTINNKNIDDFCFRIINGTDIISISPVYMNEKNKFIIGYLSTRLRLLPLLKTLSTFQYIKLDTLLLDMKDPSVFINTLETENFSYDLRKAEGIVILEEQMRESIIGLLLIIVIPTMILFAVLIFLVGMPIKEVDNYINRLRTNPEIINDKSYRGIFQIKELKSVYDSLVKYHTELSQKEEHISLTLNSIGDAVITTDAENRVVRMNPVAEQLTGWSFTEAQGKPVNQVFKLIDVYSRNSIDGPFNRVIDTGQIVHISEDSILVSRDGAEFHISDSAAPIRDEAGKIRGIVLVFNDITERKLKDEQLQQSQKMDALGKLTGGIAHDFNNLLGVILGYSELLILHLDGQPKSLRYAKQIHGAGERARKLTAKLLNFTRKETPSAMVTDVNQLILSEQDMLTKTLTARIELKLQLEDDVWPVYIDQSQLRDAILNMSINAMHAMPDGGILTLSTKKIVAEDSAMQRIGLDLGDYIQLSITDTGTGMDKNTCRKIFDPFFTTKGEKGTGLGMSQVYGLVQQSRGAVDVNSEPGCGTQITIYFPRYQVFDYMPEGKQESSLLSAVNQTGNETILVVDDESALLELSCQILDDHGYHTLQASSGNEALDMLEKQDVDLLLSDVIMPKMNGYQLAEIVTEKYPQIKIQMVSGFSDDQNLEAENDQLHKRQLHKPFSSAELLKRVRETLDG